MQKPPDVGATAIMVLNNGGRQMDSTPATFDCIKSILNTIGNDLEVIVDGDIRRGNHIIKAIAAGAGACSISRAYLCGLSAGGQARIEKCLSIFQTELERSISILGTQTIKDIKPEDLSQLNEPNV